jgi:glycosyltransferase involved in cell wall biosynthesis
MNSGPIAILFLIDYFHRTGGTEKHLAQLIAGLSPQQFRATVVAFDLGENPLLDELRRRGIPIIHLPVGREYVPNALRQAWRLSRLVRRQRFDIVQTYHQKSDTFGALVVWLAGARHLISSKRDTGDLRKPLHRFLNRRLQGLFERFIMVADGVRKVVVARDHLPPDRVVTIYNGVDADWFLPPTAEQRQAARRRLGLESGEAVVGMVAGFRPEKNHDVFFAGAERALAAVPNLRVLAVGAGELLESFRSRLADSPLGARTLFAGEVADVRPWLWAMDVGCLTPGSNEGFSNAVIEQMAVGLPMIVTDVGGNAEAVVNGETGLVIPPGDPGAVAAALTSVFADPARLQSMGRAARRRVEEHFSLQRMCAAHTQQYAALVGRQAPPVSS